MYLTFVLDRQDILPFEDVAFLQSYTWLYKTKDTSKASVEKRCKKMGAVCLHRRQVPVSCIRQGIHEGTFPLVWSE